jgi:DNA polymerase III alpha subunit (gram-positive type)
MKNITYIIIAAAIVIGGYTYYTNQQAKEVARIEADAAAEKAAVEAAAKVAADAKAAADAAAAEAKAAEEAALKVAQEAAAEAKRIADEAAAKVAEEAAAAAKAVEEAAAKAAEEAAAAAKKVADEAAAAAKAAQEAAAKAAEEAAAKAAEEAAAKVAEEAAAKAAEEAAAKVAEEAAAATKAAEEAAAVAKAAEEVAAAKAAQEAAAAEAANAATPMMPPFGSESDVGFAGKIWAAMLDQNLAGADMLRAAPYEGTEPHGMMLELFTTSASIDGREGDLIVKRNFGPVGVTTDQVLENPDQHLAMISVMFRREAGYDEETKNWFWVNFMPDGTVAKNPNGMSLAGKIAKGMDVGCIACHVAADGDDFVYSPGAFE